MVQKTKPTAKKRMNILDTMTPEERAKVSRGKLEREKRVAGISNEWMGLAELGFYYGWSAVRDVLDDYITIEQANTFIQGARKLHSSHVYDLAVASLAGNSTKSAHFERLVKRYVDNMTVGTQNG
jgi:hypothetical protein